MYDTVYVTLVYVRRDGRVLVTYGGKSGGGNGAGTGGGGGGAQKQKQYEEEEPSVKFLMLNPSVHFDEIVQKVRY